MPFFWDGVAPAPRLLSPIPPGKMLQRPSFRGPGLYFRLLAGLTRVLVHWADDFSFPCLRNECLLCASHDLRWRAYAPALAYEKGTWVPRVMEASENFVELLGKDLRGKTLCVWKEAHGRKGHKGHKESVPILFQFVPEDYLYGLPRDLPEPFDFVPFLLRLWQKESIKDQDGREYVRVITGGLRESAKVIPPWFQPPSSEPKRDEAAARWQAAWDALPDNERDAITVIVLARYPHLRDTRALLEQQCVQELSRRQGAGTSAGGNGNGQAPPPKG